jgi:hypothetical protein
MASHCRSLGSIPGAIRGGWIDTGADFPHTFFSFPLLILILPFFHTQLLPSLRCATALTRQHIITSCLQVGRGFISDSALCWLQSERVFFIWIKTDRGTMCVVSRICILIYNRGTTGVILANSSLILFQCICSELGVHVPPQSMYIIWDIFH